MEALIFAAGLGTRLRPLTDSGPKALVEVEGRPLLERVIGTLKDAGTDHVVINLHHHPRQIRDFLATHNNFGIDISFSEEKNGILETGGGLKQAAALFRESDTPKILHNVDVISNVDLGKMLDFHQKNQALATLFVQQRTSSRYLLFDANHRLCGWRNVKTGEEILPCPSPGLTPLPFNGIHVVDPKLPGLLTETGKFSIIKSYLRLCRDHRVLGYRSDAAFYLDVGKPESIQQASHLLKNRK